TAGVGYTWSGVDGSGTFQPDSNYTFVATNHFGTGCTGFNLGSASGTIKVSNVASITLQPPPASVTLYPGQGVTIVATLKNTLNASVPDGTLLNWSAVGSVTGNMNADLSATVGAVGGGSGGCSVTANTGQACQVLTLPTGARTIQTITVTASTDSQTYDSNTASVVTGQTTINDPPASPSNLQLSLGSIILHWDPSADGRAAGYKIFIGTQSHQYTVDLDVGDTTSYEYHDVVPGTTYYVTVRAYSVVGVLSHSAPEGVLTIPMPTPTPTAPATATETATPMATASPTATSTASPTAMFTPAATATSSATPGRTPGPTATARATATAIPSGCATPVATPTAQPAATASPMAGVKPGGTSTPTTTATAQPSCTATPTITETPTPTPIVPATPTFTPAPSPTTVVAATSTAGPVRTATASPTGIASATATAPASPTASATPSAPPTATATASAPPTATRTVAPTATPTVSPTRTAASATPGRAP
ncbi:MAG TPA: fibronectin type III domain-containing protein, partial [Chloroflexota bacterium]